jgi:hypothetical protein
MVLVMRTTMKNHVEGGEDYPTSMQSHTSHRKDDHRHAEDNEEMVSKGSKMKCMVTRVKSRTLVGRWFALLYLLAALVVLNHVLWNNKVTRPLPAKEGEVSISSSSNTICTEKASFRPRPKGVSKKQYKRVLDSESVFQYIIEKLKADAGAPVTLMYGSMLHEFRNGTGPCVQCNFNDKDLDIGVFAQHFPLVIAMSEDIQKKFGYKLEFVDRGYLMMVFLPENQKRVTSNQKRVVNGHQIDIYGFECNRPRAGLVYQPWMKQAFAMDAFLPLGKHKTIPYNHDDIEQITKDGHQPACVYMPFNPPCLLENLYGSDFMTPREGRGVTGGSNHARLDAFNNPDCKPSSLSSADREASKTQQSLWCGSKY